MNPMMDEEMPEGGDDTDALLEELQRAEDAGEQYSADNFFAPVPGAEPEDKTGDVKVEAEGQMDPEKLQQLLQMLQDQSQG